MLLNVDPYIVVIEHRANGIQRTIMNQGNGLSFFLNGGEAKAARLIQLVLIAKCFSSDGVPNFDYIVIAVFSEHIGGASLRNSY